MIYVKATNPDALRAGEWAHLFSIQHTAEGKDIWIVEFDDGATDAWPSWDAGAEYDVKIQIEPPEVEHDDQVQASRPVRDAARALLAQRTTDS